MSEKKYLIVFIYRLNPTRTSFTLSINRHIASRKFCLIDKTKSSSVDKSENQLSTKLLRILVKNYMKIISYFILSVIAIMNTHTLSTA